MENNKIMDWSAAGDLEKEAELLQEEVYAPDITNQTAFFTLICC